MLKIEQGIKQDRLLRALTGLNRKAFETLLPTFKAFCKQTIREKQKQLRQRPLGGSSLVLFENAFPSFKHYSIVINFNLQLGDVS